MKRNLGELVWVEVNWQRPYELETVLSILSLLASISPRGAIAWEIRGHKGKIRYFLGASVTYLKKIKAAFTTYGDVRFTDLEELETDRVSVDFAKEIKVSKSMMSLKTDVTLSTIRAGMSAMLQTRRNETLVMQIIFGEAHAPAPVPHKLADPNATWMHKILGEVQQASQESRALVKEKLSCHRFSVVIRIGATGTPATAPANIYNLLSAMRTLESAGVRITADSIKPEKLDNAHIPWSFKLILSIKEIAGFLLLPVSDVELPGAASLHPKIILPPAWYRSKSERAFAISTDGKTNLSISAHDALEHSYIGGPTGSGKSTAMLSMIMADIYNSGRSVLVLDPKADLISSILERIPESRDDDVVILDPSDHCPCGFNPLSVADKNNPHLVADSILAVLSQIFKDHWGIKTMDVLTAALLTLVQTEGASLLWLPTMLTDEHFRKKITSGVKDRLGLQPYWESFEAMSEKERRVEVSPVLNKLRQFLLRPGLRNVLGQSNPKFNLADLFSKPRIVLVPLNKGIIGAESAKLLGSLIVGLTWTLALGQARLPAEKRRHVSVFIDEVQDYLSLPSDLSDSLAQARGLKVALHLANQYREQLPPELRAGVDANCRNKIYFGMSSSDAKSVAAMAPELEAVDFQMLPRYHVYTSFQQNGRNTGWLSGKTLPPSPPHREVVDLRAKSMAKYGKSAEQVEDEYLEMLASCRQPEPAEEPPEPETIGRRKRS